MRREGMVEEEAAPGHARGGAREDGGGRGIGERGLGFHDPLEARRARGEDWPKSFRTCATFHPVDRCQKRAHQSYSKETYQQVNIRFIKGKDLTAQAQNEDDLTVANA